MLLYKQKESKIEALLNVFLKQSALLINIQILCLKIIIHTKAQTYLNIYEELIIENSTLNY